MMISIVITVIILIILVYRFGEESLHSCEVMLKDIEDSKRTNNAVHARIKQERSTKVPYLVRETGASHHHIIFVSLSSAPFPALYFFVDLIWCLFYPFLKLADG